MWSSRSRGALAACLPAPTRLWTHELSHAPAPLAMQSRGLKMVQVGVERRGDKEVQYLRPKTKRIRTVNVAGRPVEVLETMRRERKPGTASPIAPLPGPAPGNITKAVEAKLMKQCDPTGERQRMFDRRNPDQVRVGAVVLVESYVSLASPPGGATHQFAGFLIDIKRAGIGTGITLRNKLGKLGVEMQFKVFSPMVRSIRILSPKGLRKVRRARLNYLRKPEHDKGDVTAWLVADRALRARQK